MIDPENIGVNDLLNNAVSLLEDVPDSELKSYLGDVIKGVVNGVAVDAEHFKKTAEELLKQAEHGS